MSYTCSGTSHHGTINNVAPKLGTETLAALGRHLELSVVPAQLLASGLVAWQVTKDFSNHSFAVDSEIVIPGPQPHLRRGVHHGHHGCQPQQARSSTQFCVHLSPFWKSFMPCCSAFQTLSFRSYPLPLPTLTFRMQLSARPCWESRSRWWSSPVVPETSQTLPE